MIDVSLNLMVSLHVTFIFVWSLVGAVEEAALVDTSRATRLLPTKSPKDDEGRKVVHSAPKNSNQPHFELVPGLSYWLRGDARVLENFNQNDPRSSMDIRQQARLHIAARYGPVATFVQVQDARLWGFERSSVSNDANTDLHQGYIQLRGEIKAQNIWGELRVGRQEIAFGSRRLIAERPWNLVGQSYDAIRMRGRYRMFELEGWLALLRLRQTFQVPNEEFSEEGVAEYTSSASYIGGFQMSAFAMPGLVVAVQVLGIHQQRTPEEPNDFRDLVNVGLRLQGKPSEGLFYELEAFLQQGEQRGRDHFAWAGAAVVDYSFTTVRTRPTIHSGYTIASGEACLNQANQGETCTRKGVSREFWDFSGRRHGYQGIIDLARLRNIRDLELGGSLKPAKGVQLELTYHFFQLQEPRGIWWKNAPLQQVGQGWDSENKQHNLGHEIDVVASYLPWKNYFTVQPGYAVYFPVDAGRTIGGGANPRHFFYLLLRSRF